MTTGISGPPSTGVGGGGGGTPGVAELLGVYYDPATKAIIDASGNPVDLSDLEEGPVTDMWGNLIAT